MKPVYMLAIVGALAAALAFAFLGSGGQPGNGAAGGGRQSALVGGHFALVDHKGKKVTNKNYRGKYMLVYFGYIHCPEICPTSLQAISDAMEQLGPAGDQVVPLFITVDPERDKVEDLADYVSNFDPRIVGLTGTKEQVQEASKGYRVYSKKVTSEDQVDFDHSAITFFMGPDGRYLTHFAYGVQGDVMAKTMKAIFKKRAEQKVSQAGSSKKASPELKKQQ